MAVLGTRPEAIKLAPVVKPCAHRPEIELLLYTTRQHREMIRQVFKLFGLELTMDLSVMLPGRDLADVTSGVLARLSQLLRDHPVDGMMVQGDTTTAFATSLAAYCRKRAVVHVEVSLRSSDIYAPWPEEVNRRMISTIGALDLPRPPKPRSI